MIPASPEDQIRARVRVIAEEVFKLIQTRIDESFSGNPLWRIAAAAAAGCELTKMASSLMGVPLGLTSEESFESLVRYLKDVQKLSRVSRPPGADEPSPWVKQPQQEPGAN